MDYPVDEEYGDEARKKIARSDNNEIGGFDGFERFRCRWDNRREKTALDGGARAFRFIDGVFAFNDRAIFKFRTQVRGLGGHGYDAAFYSQNTLRLLDG